MRPIKPEWQDWEAMMFDWMVWTTPVAVFFTCIALMLVGMTVWELKSPTTLRKGFLPIATTRGDRLFIGLLIAAYINLAFIGLAGKFAGVVRAGERAQHLDQLRAVDGRAGADHAQGLTATVQRIRLAASPGP